jgi:vacuolar-type H+-ATPase subunit H
MNLQQMLARVEFAEARRGYEPTEVRSFLSEVSRHVAELERKSSQTGSDDEVRRTLVLAQRAADAAVAEAKDEAQRILSAAQERARRMLADAEAQISTQHADAERQRTEMLTKANEQSVQLVAAAETEARRSSDEMVASLREQVAQLGDQRARLAQDIERLEGQSAAQRRRIESSIATLQILLDNPDLMATMDEVSIEEFGDVDEAMFTGTAPQVDLGVASLEPRSTSAADTFIDLTDDSATIDLREPAEPLAVAESEMDTSPRQRLDLGASSVATASATAVTATAATAVAPAAVVSAREVVEVEPVVMPRQQQTAMPFAEVLERKLDPVMDPITAEIPVIATPAVQIDGELDDAELLRRFLDAEPGDPGRWRRRRR